MPISERVIVTGPELWGTALRLLQVEIDAERDTYKRAVLVSHAAMILLMRDLRTDLMGWLTGDKVIKR